MWRHRLGAGVPPRASLLRQRLPGYRDRRGCLDRLACLDRLGHQLRVQGAEVAGESPQLITEGGELTGQSGHQVRVELGTAVSGHAENHSLNHTDAPE